ncbi:MAG: hypothetical protein ABWX61_06755, partial [Paenisporosarcina sp.]
MERETMDESAKINKLKINQAHMTFLFPFSYREKNRKKIGNHLLSNEYTFFQLKKKELEDAYYGSTIRVKNEELDQYFLPFIERKMFPHTISDDGFLRFSKEINEQYTQEILQDSFPFTINSVDIIIGSFGIGFIAIRTVMNQTENELSDVLNFMNHFRVLEPKIEEERGAVIKSTDQEFSSTNKFVFDYLCPEITQFVIHDEKRAGYFGSLPFFEDERMLTSAFLIAPSEEQL